MSIWADINRRSQGHQVRKEDLSVKKEEQIRNHLNDMAEALHKKFPEYSVQNEVGYDYPYILDHILKF